MNTGRRYLAGAGTQSAGLSFGGYDVGYSVITEEYDGTSWIAANNLNDGRPGLAGGGTQSAGLSFGGGTSDGPVTEEYDGISWISSNDLNTGRRYLGGCGTQTAGLSFGGEVPVATTEEYNAFYLQDLVQGELDLYITYSYV